MNRIIPILSCIALFASFGYQIWLHDNHSNNQSTFSSEIDELTRSITIFDLLRNHNISIDLKAVDTTSWCPTIFNSNCCTNNNGDCDINTAYKQLAIFFNELTNSPDLSKKYKYQSPWILKHDQTNSFLMKYWNGVFGDNKWNPDYFSKFKIKDIDENEIVYSQAFPVFKTFHDNKPLESFLTQNSLKWQDFNPNINDKSSILNNQTLQSVIFNSNNIKNQQFKYFASVLSDFDIDASKVRWKESLLNDIASIESLSYDDSNPSYNSKYHSQLFVHLRQEEKIDINDNNNNNNNNDNILNDLEPILKLRLSNKGMQTYMHFDTSWNHFIQIYGKKLFILISPNENENGNLFEYPCIHPHSSHSQLNHIFNQSTNIVDHDDDDCDVSNIYKVKQIKNDTLTIHIALLEKGDVLFIPPYWWHHVISLTDSISLHYWLNSNSFLLINQIYEIPIPFEYEWGFEKKLLFLRVFFHCIFDWQSQSMLQSMPIATSKTLCKDNENGSKAECDTESLLIQLYNIRYKQLLEYECGFGSIVFDKEIDNQFKNEYCNDKFGYFFKELKDLLYGLQHDSENVQLERVFLIILQYLTEFDESDPAESFKHVRSLANKFERVSKQIYTIFMKINPQSVRLLLAKNYIEHVINFVLGTQNVAYFLKQCV